MKRLTIGIAALACVLVGGALSYAALTPPTHQRAIHRRLL